MPAGPARSGNGSERPSHPTPDSQASFVVSGFVGPRPGRLPDSDACRSTLTDRAESDTIAGVEARLPSGKAASVSTSELPSIVDLLPSEIDRAIRLRLATVEGDVFVRFRLDGQSVEAEVLEARPAAEHRPSGTALELRGMAFGTWLQGDRKSTRLNSSHIHDLVCRLL